MPSVDIETSTQTPMRKPKKRPLSDMDPLQRRAALLAKSGRISDKEMRKLKRKAKQKDTA